MAILVMNTFLLCTLYEIKMFHHVMLKCTLSANKPTDCVIV